LVPLGGAHSLAREGVGWESPNSDEGTYTVVLFIYIYFVVYPIKPLRKDSRKDKQKSDKRKIFV
jgi:hypothetical protein